MKNSDNNVFRINKMKRLFYCCCLIFILNIVITDFGCNKKGPPPSPKDGTLSGLNWFLNNILKNDSIPESSQLVNLAKSKWQNGILDPEPFLLYNQMTQSRNDTTVAGLSLCIYDEEKDVVGIIIEEEHFDSQGNKTTLKEKYPVFLHFTLNEVLCLKSMHVYIRNGNTKDEEQWKEYEQKSEDQIMNEFYALKKRTNGPFIETLPDVWISIPEPKKINVNLYIYDRKGNVSNPLKLRYIKKRF